MITDELRALHEAMYKSFDVFAMEAFKSVEGEAAQYQWNWHIGCIAEHLQAVHRGEIRKLIINVPPRTLKSYLVSSAFPAWVFAVKPGILGHSLERIGWPSYSPML